PRPHGNEPDAPRHGTAGERAEGARTRRLPPREILLDEGFGPRGEDPRTGAVDHEADGPPARTPPEDREDVVATGRRRRGGRRIYRHAACTSFRTSVHRDRAGGEPHRHE